MKHFLSSRTIMPILVLIVLLSPMVNIFIPENTNTSPFEITSSIPEPQFEEDISPTWIDHPKPSSEHIDLLDNEESKIVTFTDFEARDLAIEILPENSISNSYNYIPSIAVNHIELSEYDLTGIVSVTADMKFKSATVSDQLVNLGSQIQNGHTLHETGQMIGTNYLKAVYGLSGVGTKIAVLDTGVNRSLNAFEGKVENQVVTDLELKGDLDQDGHGTHVTGIISSNGVYNLNGDFVQTDSEGVAPGAEILSIRVLDETGVGDNSWIVEGIELAIAADVDIISLSLSTVIYEGTNDPMQLVVNEAISRGIMVIAAAGNTGPVGSGIGIPGALDGVIAVGASFPFNSQSWELWTFSAVGPSIEASGPDLIAPGSNILSIDASDGTIEELSGTSMSTPHISGGIALLREAFPSASPEQIREAMLASSQLVFNSNGHLEQVEAQGRGQVRFDIAHLVLNETINTRPESHLQMSIIPNIIQDRNYVYHHRTIGETKELPFYIYTSRSITVNPVINITKTSGVDFNLPASIDLSPGKNRIDIGLEVLRADVGLATGELYFVEESTGLIIPNSFVTYDTLTRYPESRILFDTTHDGDTPSGYFGNHGPNGQMSQMAKSLAFKGQIVDATGSQIITENLLDNYDMLVIANPDRTYLSSEIDAVRKFVEIDGKALFVIVSGGLLTAEGEPTYAEFNRNDLNSILQNTGISIPEDNTTPLSTSRCDFDGLSYDRRTEVCLNTGNFLTSQSIFDDDLQYPHFGPQLAVDGSNGNTQELAHADGQLVAAASEFDSNGRVMVFSSQLPFDNVGILYDYLGPHTAQSNEGMLHSSIDWLLEPRQAKMITEVNGMTGTEFDLNMYERILLKVTPQDHLGTIIRDLGEAIEFDIQGYDFKYPFTQIGENYFLELQNGLDFTVSLNLFYYLNPENSIPSDSQIILNINLKNFYNQENFRGVALLLTLLIVSSWVVWIKNEGGRELWKLRQSQKLEEEV